MCVKSATPKFHIRVFLRGMHSPSGAVTLSRLIWLLTKMRFTNAPGNVRNNTALIEFIAVPLKFPVYAISLFMHFIS